MLNIRYNIKFCLPDVIDEKDGVTSFEELYDLSLICRYIKEGSFEKLSEIFPNDFSMDKGRILIVTGANQGGKTTFLKSIGIAQIFMQVGVHAAAKSFKSSPASYIATHFPREEDSNLTSGKLEEELRRLYEIFVSMKRNSFILFNEPFTTTTVKEGSSIAEDVIKALSYTRSRVVFVTHFYELASALYRLDKEADKENKKIHLYNGEKIASLVAEVVKDPDAATVQGTYVRRTYGIIPGEPKIRVYADDIIKQYFCK